MTQRTRIALVLLVFAYGLAGCDGSRSPLAPSTVVPPTPPSSTPPPPAQQVYTLTPSATTVAPGGTLSLSWTASRGGAGDWIGLYRVGAPECDHGWSDATRGATSGTFTLTAPLQSGQYEFRYQPDDGCFTAARSSAVTVN
jgi:hypothetical protein